ncbi:MAG: hypothetical protein ABI411_07595 [Tahibacter sp.]
MRFLSVRHSALSLALAGAFLALPSAQAAVRFSEAVDGLYADTTHPGRGWVVDHIAFPNGDGIFYMFSSAYDSTGKQVWLTTNFDTKEFEYKKTDIPFAIPTGGRFGDTWPTAVSTTISGKMDVEIMSCDEIKLTLRPDATTGLPTSTQTLTSSAAYVDSVPGLDTVNDRCAIKRKFTTCPAGTTAGPVDRSCILTGTIASNLTLTNETTWILKGLVKVGTDNSNKVTLTIEPGTLITGSGNTADYLYVEPGSKINAQGTPYAPIIFTSQRDGVVGGTPAPKDWGGIVVSGNAPNNKCLTAPFDCRSEFDPTLRYGGDKPHESSGVIDYVQVRYAGYVFQPTREVNSFTFQSVGDGTVVDHIQSYRGGDDGIEFFGGNVGVKHAVLAEGGDDGLDWDEGYSGKIQFVLLQHGTGLGEDNGIEASNQNANQDATPRAQPTVANLTMIGNGNGGDGIRFKEGTGGHIKNSVFTGFKASCLNLVNTPTFTAAGTPSALTGVLTVDHTLFNCTTQFKQDDGAPWTAQAFYTAQTGNLQGDPLMQGFLPKAGSPLLDSGLIQTNDAFFTPTSYIGAFRDGNDDWTKGWTYNVKR